MDRNAQPLARHCARAEQAADEGLWQQAQAEVAALHADLQKHIQAGDSAGFRPGDALVLSALSKRIKRLRSRAADAREAAAQTLCDLRKQRSAADAYRRCG